MYVYVCIERPLKLMKSEARVQGCGSELTVTGSLGVNTFNWTVCLLFFTLKQRKRIAMLTILNQIIS